MRTSRTAVLAASVAALSLVLVGCSDGEGSTSDTTSKAAATQPDAEPADVAPSEAPLIGVGQSATLNWTPDGVQFKVTYRSARVISAEEAEDAAEQPPGGVYVRVGLTVENVGKASGVVDDDAFKWSSSSVAEQDATTYAAPSGASLATTYQPGQSVTGDVVLYALGRGGEFSYAPSGAGSLMRLRVPQ